MRSLGGEAQRERTCDDTRAWSRRSFLQRAGLLGAASVLAQLPALLDARGLLAAAAAQTPDLTLDTMNGLVAFVLPGDDPYSVAQGERFDGPGAVEVGAAPLLIEELDLFVPVAAIAGPSTTLPASGAVASLLNGYAMQVNPAASRGGFPSPFARLSFAEKAKVFELFESDPKADGSELRFVAGLLVGFVSLIVFSEATVLDRERRVVTERPLGWEISGYGGPAEGHAELKGYWRGMRTAIDA